MKISLKKFFLIIILSLFSLPTNAEEKNIISSHQYNFYTGNFDFSDHKQKAILFGFQHQNENLVRKTFLGNASPVTGGFITENSAAYIYTGVEWNYDMGDGNFFLANFLKSLKL